MESSQCGSDLAGNIEGSHGRGSGSGRKGRKGEQSKDAQAPGGSLAGKIPFVVDKSMNIAREESEKYIHLLYGQSDNIKDEESEDNESEDQETEDEDPNLAVENGCDGEKLLGQMKTNDAGESYLRMGDYVCVYVKDSKKEEIRDEEEAEDGCPICLGDHCNLECPWRDNVPPGQQVGRLYDIKCKGCGKWGLACCAEGGLAVLRRCGRCFDFGHWGDVCPNYKYMRLAAFPNYP